MSIYEYRALDVKGKERKGIINAESNREAVKHLRAQGLYPRQVHISQTRKGNAGQGLNRIFSLGRRINQADLVVTLRQIATLLSAGLPLTVCLESTLQQTKKGGVYRVFAQILSRINQGSSLAGALEEQESVFPSTYSAMIRAGESSGTLELVLERIAEFGEQQQTLKNKLQSSLAYPVLILLVSLAVIFFLMSYVVPKVSRIFLDFDQALPLPTTILIKVTDLFSHYWWCFPVGFLAVIVVLKRMSASAGGKFLLDSWTLKLPLVGPIVENIVLNRFSHILGVLLKNDITLLQALKIVRNVVSNTVLQQAVDRIITEVSQGSTLAQSMAREKIFPPTVVQLIAAGEQSGRLETIFLKITQNSEDQVTTRLAMLTSLLEPIMILALGGACWFCGPGGSLAHF